MADMDEKIDRTAWEVNTPLWGALGNLHIHLGGGRQPTCSQCLYAHNKLYLKPLFSWH